MASIGHIAVGLAAARAQRGRLAHWPALAGWSALSLLPDADVIGMPFGIPYEAVWGHRGATHSVVFAASIGLVIAAAAPWFRWPAVRTGLIGAAVVASHAVLDTLTDGGLGCALFWPFNLTRYFAPWRPIPVAPLGLAFFTPSGAFVSAVELILFAPLFWYAWRRVRPRLMLVSIWMVAVWFIESADPVRERIMGTVLREETQYASGYSERAFREISVGDSVDSVRQRLGAPLGEWWDYRITADNPCPFVYIADGVVTSQDLLEVCIKHGLAAGTTADAVRATLGAPYGMCWAYTQSPGGRWFRGRGVCLEDGKVRDVLRRWAHG